MAYTIGTATGHKAVLQALVNFAAANNWTVLSQDFASAEATVYLQGPGGGSGPDDYIYVGIQTETAANSGLFNWILNGYSGYTSGAAFLAQPGSIHASALSRLPRVTLKNATMKYWFFATPRALVGFIKVGNLYANFYLGAIKPFGPPSTRNYFLYIAGNAGPDTPAGRQSNFSVSFFEPTLLSSNVNTGPSTGYFLDDTATWQTLYHTTASGASSLVSSADNHIIWPFLWRQGSTTQMPNMGGMPNGQPRLTPAFLVWFTNYAATRAVYGALDGVFAANSENISPEDIISSGGQNYIVFPSVYPDNRRMVAILMEA